MNEATLDELPWCDCKVAYEFDDPQVFETWWDDTDGGKGLLPAGWYLCEADRAGARYVVIFRIEGQLRIEDGEAVAKLLVAIAANPVTAPPAGKGETPHPDSTEKTDG